MTFENAIAFTLSSGIEGGLSEDPQDPGGLTKFGISQRAYPDLNIRNLTREHAIEIYKRDYWDRCRCDGLPWPISLLVFDSAVNHGAPRAIRWLQTALGLKADGVVGALTIRAAWSASPDVSIDVLSSRALNYAGDAGVLHFGRGWMRRLFLLHAEILQCSEK